MILITGGAGFIGTNFVNFIKEKSDCKSSILVVDNLSYASNFEALKSSGVDYEIVDISKFDSLKEVFKKHRISSVINFAAESHVDNSINNCIPFVESNIIGTINLLKLSVDNDVEKFIQISTDEVFGTVTNESFSESSQINPRNPYSASKASAEHFVKAFSNTYKIPTIIINSSNNYGPFQYPEKLIPLTIKNLLNGKHVPVYGDGQQIRDWIYVQDACEIIYEIFKNGKFGERYCIGGDNQVKNLDLVKTIINKLNLDESRIEFVKDRPGHDTRYHTDISKVKTEFNWAPKWNIDDGLNSTIEWIKNEKNFNNWVE
jgi:dTDP-glucose 4,6-dehydratase